MTDTPESIRILTPQELQENTYEHHLADCVILTQDHKLLLQYRPKNWGSSPDSLNIFGGHVEQGETVTEGLIREIYEELGANMPIDEIKYIGALTEDFTGHKDVVHVHFWHDKDGLITGCYEAEARTFDSVGDAVSQNNIMDYSVWALNKCSELGYLSNTKKHAPREHSKPRQI